MQYSLISILVILVSAFIGAFLQSSIGFGCAVVMMNIITFVLPAGKAIILCQSGCILLAMFILNRNWKRIRWNVVLPIMIPSLICSFIATRLSIGLDIGLMKFMIGILFILLALYFSIFASRIHMKPNRITGISLGIVSGTLNGFFSVGGPPAVLYMAPSIDDKKDYMASTQALFVATNIMSLSVRLASGQAQKGDIPIILICFVGIIAGTTIGIKVSGRMPADLLRRLVYIFVGINGIIIVLTSGMLGSKDLTVSLEENPTTGFRWEYSIEPDGILRLKDDDYVIQSNTAGLVGAPGIRTFTFEVLEKQSATVTFVLRRSWETEPPVETRTFIYQPKTNSLTEEQ